MSKYQNRIIKIVSKKIFLNYLKLTSLLLSLFLSEILKILKISFITFKLLTLLTKTSNRKKLKIYDKKDFKVSFP